MKLYNVLRLLRQAGLAALLMVGWAGAAHAQKVLILQADESTSGDPYGAGNIQTNLRNEFSNAGATVTVQSVLTTPGAVTASTFATAPGPYDLVIVSTIYLTADAGNMAAVQAAINGRAAKAFLLFIDGCCGAPNVSYLLAAVRNTTTGAGIAVGTSQNSQIAAPLNTASPYATGGFTTLDPFNGGWVTYLDNVPTDNALYLTNGARLPPVGATQSAYGVFFPQSQVNGGAGACLFGVVDGSEFYDGSVMANMAPVAGSPYVLNQGKIAPAFLAALNTPRGACGLPAASVTKSFAPATVALGGGATLTIRLNNLSNPAMSLTGAQVQDVLPAPLVIGGTITRSCTGGTLTGAVGGSTLALSGTTIPTGGCSVTVPVRWPYAAGAASCPAGAPTTATNTITPPTQFSTDQGQSTTPATATLQCDPTLAPVVPPAVAAVPTLHGALLALLGAALAVFGWRQRPA